MKKIAILLLLLPLTVTAFASSTPNPKIAPELQGYSSTQQVQIIVQYAPGTQLSCTGIIGLVDCLLNDIVKLGGTIVGPLPLVNGSDTPGPHYAFSSSSLTDGENRIRLYSIQDEQWKLVFDPEKLIWTLFNLRDDQKETKNVANEQPVELQRLKSALLQKISN